MKYLNKQELYNHPLRIGIITILFSITGVKLLLFPENMSKIYLYFVGIFLIWTVYEGIKRVIEKLYYKEFKKLVVIIIATLFFSLLAISIFLNLSIPLYSFRVMGLIFIYITFAIFHKCNEEEEIIDEDLFDN